VQTGERTTYALLSALFSVLAPLQVLSSSVYFSS
jgi:hypothetical protein